MSGMVEFHIECWSITPVLYFYWGRCPRNIFQVKRSRPTLRKYNYCDVKPFGYDKTKSFTELNFHERTYLFFFFQRKKN